jgi:hypothetical protein
MHYRSALSLVSFFGLAASCLPGDERPIPASVYVFAEPSAATRDGFITDDGWTISFDRFLTALGDVDLDADPDSNLETCSDYSETNYDRLFDFTQVTSEKIGIVYGLGTCSVEFRLRSPSDDALIEAGATEVDVETMRERATDAYVEEQRTAVWVIGTATKGDEVRSFDWLFRTSYEIDRCTSSDGEKYVSVVSLEGAARVELRVEVRGEELFRSVDEDAAPFLFEPFANADADEDTILTLEELDAVPYFAPPEEDETAPETLGALVYQVLVPRVARLGDAGPCEAEERNRRF